MDQSIDTIANMIASAASEKKAQDILILDMEGISSVADAFIICSANSTKQIQAIAENIEEELAKKGQQVLRREGYREAQWILLDYGACVVHIFVTEERTFYNLEQLWGDAKRHQYSV